MRVSLSFESGILSDIARAFELRGKAIRYHGELRCSGTAEDSVERLNVDFKGSSGFRVRLSIWPDKVLWLGITKPGPSRAGGWAFRDEFHGHLEDRGAPDVVERFERTVHSPREARSFWLE